MTGDRLGVRVRAVILLAVLVVTFVVADRVGAPDRATVQALVDRAGGWAPLWFVGGYAVWSLLPVPKSLATVAAGAAFGLASGSLLAWLGAVLGALVAFAVARGLGRDLVARGLRGRLAAVDDVLGDRGFVTVLVARLIPVVPFTAVNYGAGVTGVRVLPYLTATMLGMVPGTLAYAALGAYGGVDPTRTALTLAALVALSVGGWGLARQRRRPPADGTPPSAELGPAAKDG